MENFRDLKELIEREAVKGGHWASVTCNGVYIQIYDHLRRKPKTSPQSETQQAGPNSEATGEAQVWCAQVEFNARLGTQYDEADLRAVEDKPGHLIVAVVPNGECSIDWGHTKRFVLSKPLEALLEAFPNGRNIGPIVEALKTFHD